MTKAMQTDINNFWSEGNLDTEAVAQFLEFDKNDLSKIADIPCASIEFGENISDKLFLKMSQIAEICNLVTVALDSDKEKAKLWFSTTNPHLGEITPRDMIRIGRCDKLKAFVQQKTGS